MQGRKKTAHTKLEMSLQYQSIVPIIMQMSNVGVFPECTVLLQSDEGWGPNRSSSSNNNNNNPFKEACSPSVRNRVPPTPVSGAIAEAFSNYDCHH